MANLVFKPATGGGNKVIFQNQDGTVDAITIEGTGATTLPGDSTVGGTLGVTGAATVGGTLGVTGVTTLVDSAVTGNSTVSGTLGVTGVTTFAGDIKAGTIKANDGTEAITITDSTGKVTLAGDLEIGGTVTAINTALTISDAMVINNAGTDVGIKVNSTSTGHIIQLQDGGVDQFVIADGGAVTGSAILDEDAMGSNSATKLATQQSIKAYVDASVHTPEGTAILSTGVTGTSKYLRVDGDNSCSWQEAGSPSITDNGNATAITIDASEDCTFAGNLFPSVNGVIGGAGSDLGSAAKRWRNIYTTDLHLANERGNWTVIEEEDYLTLRNNKTDKIYKLVMEEI